MKLSTLKAICLVIFSVSLIWGCSDNSTTPAAVVKPAAPKAATNLQAKSTNETSISIKWDLSLSESDANFSGYIITTFNGSVIVKTDSVAKGVKLLTIANLLQGTIYTVQVRAYDKMDTLISDPISINWSPAYRFVKNAAGVDNLALYETPSSFGSGIYLYDGALKDARSASVKNEPQVCNLAFNTTSGLIFGSSSKVNYSYTFTNSAEISLPPIQANSLDDVYDSKALDTKSFSLQTIDLSTVTSNIVIIARVPAGGGQYNYAKVLLIYNNGWLSNGSGSNRYFEYQVSYQLLPAVPYAIVKQ